MTPRALHSARYARSAQRAQAVPAVRNAVNTALTTSPKVRSFQLPLTAGTRRIGLSAALVASLAFAPASARADFDLPALDLPALEMFGTHNCMSAIERLVEDLADVGRCVGETVLAGVAGATLSIAEQRGKSVFGDGFRIDRRVNRGIFGAGLDGDMDTVIPLSSLSRALGSPPRALFLQAGVSRWNDMHGLPRTDVRYGFVHRFVTSEQRGAGVLGASALFQENLQWGHRRVALGVDYASRTGITTSLSYFMPTTGWTPGRIGHEERAAGGLEMGVHVAPSPFLSLDARVGKWEHPHGKEARVGGGALDVEWKPYPWLAVRGSWEAIGGIEDSASLSLSLATSLGPRQRAALPRREPGEEGKVDESRQMWRSVRNASRVRVAERLAHRAVDGEPGRRARQQAASGHVIIFMSGKFE